MLKTNYDAETVSIINQHYSWLNINVVELLQSNNSQTILDQILGRIWPSNPEIYRYMRVDNAQMLNLALQSANYFDSIQHRAGYYRMLSPLAMGSINKLPLIVRNIVYALVSSKTADTATLIKSGEDKILSDITESVMCVESMPAYKRDREMCRLIHDHNLISVDLSWDLPFEYAMDLYGVSNDPIIRSEFECIGNLQALNKERAQVIQKFVKNNKKHDLRSRLALAIWSDGKTFEEQWSNASQNQGDLYNHRYLIYTDWSAIATKSAMLQWRSLFIKVFGTLLSVPEEYLTKLSQIKGALGKIPQNKEELERGYLLAQYRPLLAEFPEFEKMETLIDHLVKAGIDANMGKQYARFFQNYPQNFNGTLVPEVNITLGDYRLVKLAHDDFRLPMLGEYTDCCQHLDGVGSKTARALWTNPRQCGAYVVFKRNNIVAQAAIWSDAIGPQRCEEVLVFDSIEVLGKSNETVFELFKLAVDNLLDRGYRVGFGYCKQNRNIAEHYKLRIVNNNSQLACDGSLYMGDCKKLAIIKSSIDEDDSDNPGPEIFIDENGIEFVEVYNPNDNGWDQDDDDQDDQDDDDDQDDQDDDDDWDQDYDD